MKQISLQEFKSTVLCKNNENNSFMDINFGIFINSLNGYNSDEIKSYVDKIFPSKYLSIPCCRVNIISGGAELSPPEIKEEDYNKDSDLIANEHIMNEFNRLENDLKTEFNGLDFEIIIIEGYSDYIKYF